MRINEIIEGINYSTIKKKYQRISRGPSISRKSVKDPQTYPNKTDSFDSTDQSISKGRPIYLQIANVLYNGFKNKNPAMYEEVFDLADDYDNQLVVGYTSGAEEFKKQNPQDTPYREHVVPVAELIKYAVSIYSNYVEQKNEFQQKYPNYDATKENVTRYMYYKVARLFQRNLLIVYTDEQSETSLINQRYMKTMPANWNPWTGDVYARFKEFGIPVFPIKGGRRLA